ncbi:3'-5' exoribonuclease YhaM [Spiroplasma sabaudiense Ar-1343]|uniref:3'-5' exoribonuclease YhaM n=1 Tax=Spiroplasma sabaudiense Ar-1343 TaxID=1276257 RepID=W6AJY4_9MOLU|nr:HD domain-containing protein [Spiroplasma sabaudiense]AHI54039.1 3'-5' exoribonuclease YhaM [Spiroplasma sabaudiense Ar-1343]
MKIVEIKSSDKNIVVTARVEKIVLSTGSNGMNYLIIHLVDKTGRVEARLWNATIEDKEAFKANQIVRIEAIANLYRNQIQLKINQYKIYAPDECEAAGINLQDFNMSAPINIEENWNNFLMILEEVKNPIYKKITKAILLELKEDFLSFPAAMTIHHNVVGGLFWHSYTLVRNAKSIRGNYGYANIDWDLVICGSILHDIGKIIELTDISGTDYSLEGKLLGHISIGNTIVYNTAKELELLYNSDGTQNSDVTKLQHMIIASHGKNEYGSPIEPVLLEAVILSTFDNLDARIFKINEELNKVGQDDWSARISSEEGKMFLNHFDPQKK